MVGILAMGKVMNIGGISARDRGADSGFVRVPCAQAKLGYLVLLVDTGADTSLVKAGSLAMGVKRDETVVKNLRGAFGGCSRTMGLVEVVHLDTELAFTMHCVDQGDSLPGDGILGRDNLWGRAVADTVNLVLKLYSNGGEWSMPLISFNEATGSSVVNMLGEIKVSKARSVTIASVRVDSKHSTVVIEKQELSPGVYLGATVTDVKDGMVKVPVLNATETDYYLEGGFRPRFTGMVNFREPAEGMIAHVQDTDITERIGRIMRAVKIDSDINNEERASVEAICAAYHDVFWMEGDRLSCTNVVRHRIPIQAGQLPINQKQYRLPQVHRDEINRQVQKMTEDGIISHSVSPWNSPLLLVPKKSNNKGVKNWRVVVDFRKLNEATVKQVFPIPRMDEILDQLGSSRYFSTLDLASGYHQVEMDKGDREKTAFSTALGHFEFNRMPFGLTGAPATFQRLMNHVLTGLQGIECFVYLDDIVVYGGSLVEHETRLCKVLQLLRENNLKVKTEKCNFLRREIVYLGHMCSEKGALPDPEKVKCVGDFPTPRNKKEVQSFLGLVNYYRKFIPGTAQVALPINKLLRKDCAFNWTIDCQHAFEKLKRAIITPPVLAYPDFRKPFILTTDASGGAIGAVLSQEEGGDDRPIAFASRSLCDAETRYSTIEKEFLAIVWAVKNFRPYLLGRHFKIYTDHQPLRGIANLKDQTSRLARFRHKLSEYDFEIRYKPGRKNQNADALSRIPYPSEEILMVHTRAMAKDIIAKGNNEPDVKEDEYLSAEGDQKDVRGVGTMFVPGECEEGMSNPVPTIIRLRGTKEIATVLRDFHDNPLGGHLGIKRTVERIRRQFCWRGMVNDIKKYIKKCIKCQRNKSSRKTLMPMVLTDTAVRPFQKIYMDMVGPLPETTSGNKLILTVQDDFSKFMLCAPMPDGEASTVAKVFFSEVIARYGVPSILVTDNGTNFMSKVFSETCKLLGIKKLNTTPYHPQANGSLERSHRPLAEYLRSFVDEDGSNWDQWLAPAMHVHNNAVHTSTGQTPFRTLYGFDINVPSNLSSKCAPLYNPNDPSKVLKYQLQRSHELVRKNQEKAKLIAKGNYDKRSNGIVFAVGDRVLVRNNTRKNKFSPIWTGPYEVISVDSPVTTTVRVRGKNRKWHNNHLRVYYG